MGRLKGAGADRRASPVGPSGACRLAGVRRAALIGAGLVALTVGGWYGQGLWPLAGVTEAFPGRVGREGMVRLHVVAHSDDPADQAVKLRVRDGVLAELARLYRQAPPQARSGPEQWLGYLRAHPDQLRRAAEAALQAGRQAPAGRSGAARQAVRVEIGWLDFPETRYAGGVYPEGRYRAVRVVLGDGAGRNWWCVAFPMLCPEVGPAPPTRAAAARRPEGPEGREAVESPVSGAPPAQGHPSSGQIGDEQHPPSGTPAAGTP